MELSFRIKFSLSRKLSGYELPAISKWRNVGSNFTAEIENMTEKEIENKISLVENIGGMTVNERLYVCGLDKKFDKALKNDKLKAEKILELLKVDKLSIELILKK